MWPLRCKGGYSRLKPSFIKQFPGIDGHDGNAKRIIGMTDCNQLGLNQLGTMKPHSWTVELGIVS